MGRKGVTCKVNYYDGKLIFDNMEQVNAYAQENCASGRCDDVYVRDTDDPYNNKKYQLVEISAAEEEPAPAPAPATGWWWDSWFGTTVSTIPNTARKGTKRVNNYIADRNDKNLQTFHGLSRDYKSFQKSVQAKADQSSASAVLSPVISGLNGVGTAIDVGNHLVVGGAHRGIDAITGLTRNSLEFIKPALKPAKPAKRHQPVSSE